MATDTSHTKKGQLSDFTKSKIEIYIPKGTKILFWILHFKIQTNTFYSLFEYILTRFCLDFDSILSFFPGL